MVGCESEGLGAKGFRKHCKKRQFPTCSTPFVGPGSTPPVGHPRVKYRAERSNSSILEHILCGPLEGKILCRKQPFQPFVGHTGIYIDQANKNRNRVNKIKIASNSI